MLVTHFQVNDEIVKDTLVQQLFHNEVRNWKLENK